MISPGSHSKYVMKINPDFGSKPYVLSFASGTGILLPLCQMEKLRPREVKTLSNVTQQDWPPVVAPGTQVEICLKWISLAPCSPRGSQESSPTPEFNSVNSSALSLLYGPTLTSIYDYWKNLSFD